MIESFDLVFYHQPCFDGAASAWVVQCWAQENKIPIIFRGYPYNKKDCPPDIEGKKLLFLDLTFEEKIMKEILEKAAFVTILDHHKTAIESSVLKHPKCNLVFDLDRSGAQITWDVFYPGKPRPLIIDYIGDRDLWKFKLSSSREINAVILASTPTIEDIHILYTYWNTDKFISDGTKLLAQKLKVLEDLALNFFWALMPDPENKEKYKILIGPCPGEFRSDLGDFLNKKYSPDFVALYSETYDKKYSVSFRGQGKVDCSRLAKFFGGGGHFNAAACITENLNFCSFLVG